MEGHDIEVKSLIIGKVVTTGAGRDDTELSLLTTSPKSIAVSSLNKVGRGRPVIVPYLPHAIQTTGVSLIPEALVEKIIIPVFKAEREKINKLK